MIKRKDDMSETTSDTGQAELADEPSMEDILASIRKIIADDDQTMDLSEPQALETPPAFGDTLESSSADLSPTSLIEDTSDTTSSDFDENSVFNRLSDGSDGLTEAVESAGETATDDLSGDVMDLDISALLGEADTSVEAETPDLAASKDFAVEEEDVFNSLDLEIPDIPVTPAESQSVENQIVESDTSSANIETEESSIFDLTEQVETQETVVESETTTSIDTDEDSLFDELEGLLAEVPDDIEAPSSEIVTEPPASDIEDPVETGESDADYLNPLNSVLSSEVTATASQDTETEIMNSDIGFSHSDDGSIDALLDEFTDGLVIEDDVGALGAETVEVSADEAPAFSTEGHDLPLVKSLMEDLTEPEVSSDMDESDLDITAVLPGADSESVSDMNEASSEEDDILDDILNMSLDNEITANTQGSADDVIDDLVIPEPTPETVAVDEAANMMEAQNSSLMEIAAAAEQEAEALESKSNIFDEPAIIEGPAEEAESDLALETGLTAGVLGAAATVAAKAAHKKRNKDKQKEEEQSNIAPVAEIQKVESQEETADMPRAVKSDAILDDVTETATSEVFASLNQVVEEKAIKAERGDRIGDLVMEALRPMLKEWLDANLKGIVERAVAKEVKRISSGK